ncbi:MAG: hypothetical protein PHS17_02750 [Desulfobacterales bacterium]|nr:hypothetical protein [Desulfobacterales bacterium]
MPREDHRKAKRFILVTSRHPLLHGFWKKYHEIIIAVVVAFLIAQIIVAFL